MASMDKYEMPSAKKRKILENKWLDEKTGRTYSLEKLNPAKPGYYLKDPRYQQLSNN